MEELYLKHNDSSQTMTVINLRINRRLGVCIINVVKNVKHQFLIYPVFFFSS